MPLNLRPRRDTNAVKADRFSLTTITTPPRSSSATQRSRRPANKSKNNAASSPSSSTTTNTAPKMDHLLPHAGTPSAVGRALSESGRLSPAMPGTPTSAAGSPSSAELLGLYGPRPVRAQFACDYCRQRKAKCSGTEPCDRCIAKKQTCSFSTVQNQRKVTRSLKDLHAQRLGYGMYGQMGGDPSLRGGVRMYLDRQAQRAGGDGAARRLVMSQGDGLGHVNHWYWALQQQAQQRGGIMPYGSSPALSARYHAAASSSGYQDQVWAHDGTRYGHDVGNSAWHGYGYGGNNDHLAAHYSNNMGSRSETDLHAGMATTGVAGGAGFSMATTPGSATTPVSYPQTPNQHVTALHPAQMPSSQAGCVDSEGRYQTAGASSSSPKGYSPGARPFGTNYTAAEPGAGEDVYRHDGSGASANMYNHTDGQGQSQSMAGWRYEPLPPPPASVVLQSQSQGSNGHENGSEGASTAAVAAAAAAAAAVWTGQYTNASPAALTLTGTNSSNGSFAEPAGGFSTAATAVSPADLGFRPPSPC